MALSVNVKLRLTWEIDVMSSTVTSKVRATPGPIFRVLNYSHYIRAMLAWSSIKIISLHNLFINLLIWSESLNFGNQLKFIYFPSVSLKHHLSLYARHTWLNVMYLNKALVLLSTHVDRQILASHHDGN